MRGLRLKSKRIFVIETNLRHLPNTSVVALNIQLLVYTAYFVCLKMTPCEIHTLYSAGSPKAGTCQYSRQIPLNARHHRLFPKLGRKRGYYERADLNSSCCLKYILFIYISNLSTASTIRVAIVGNEIRTVIHTSHE